ncbi:MAG: cyd operon YbgE family protein [Caulobacteraceae bacterium]
MAGDLARTHRLAAAAARAVSLSLASATAATLIAAPFLVVSKLDPTAHTLLALILAGMSAGFVHGLGMRPSRWIWRAVFSAPVAWSLMLLGWIALIATR